MLEPKDVALAQRSQHHSHLLVAYAPRPFAALLFYALTGRGIQDWMRFERDLRVFSVAGKVLMFIVALILKEWLFERVQVGTPVVIL